MMMSIFLGLGLCICQQNVSYTVFGYLLLGAIPKPSLDQEGHMEM